VPLQCRTRNGCQPNSYSVHSEAAPDGARSTTDPRADGP